MSFVVYYGWLTEGWEQVSLHIRTSGPMSIVYSTCPPVYAPRVGTNAFGGRCLPSAGLVGCALKKISKKKAGGSVFLNVSEKLTKNVEHLMVWSTYAMMSGHAANGCAPDGNTRMAATWMDELNLTAARLDGPWGVSVHQCSNFIGWGGVKVGQRTRLNRFGLYYFLWTMVS